MGRTLKASLGTLFRSLKIDICLEYLKKVLPRYVSTAAADGVAVTDGYIAKNFPSLLDKTDLEDTAANSKLSVRLIYFDTCHTHTTRTEQRPTAH
jgi:hypothetical protein